MRSSPGRPDVQLASREVKLQPKDYLTDEHAVAAGEESA